MLNRKEIIISVMEIILAIFIIAISIPIWKNGKLNNYNNEAKYYSVYNKRLHNDYRMFK